MAQPLPVLPARISPSANVRLKIAAGASSPLARRDRRGVLTSRSAGLAQFRSAAVGAASLIASVILGGIARLGARVERVFAVIQKGSGVGSLHASTIALESLPCPTTDMSISTREVLPAS